VKRWLGLAATLAGLAAPAAAQGTHLLVVTGLSGEPVYAKRFREQATQLVEAATTRWGVPDSSLVYLAEDPAADPSRIDGPATRAGVLEALGRLGSRARPDDVVLIVLFGHGSQQGSESKLSLPGPDLSAADLAAALAGLGAQTVVVVNAASASGDFLPALSGKGRVIVTATKSGFERNATLFGEHFARGLGSGDADADKDGRVSIAEAFGFARREVARVFETERRLLTEHAQLDDNGDRQGSAELTGADGALARAVTFALAPDPLAADPRAASLLVERRRLERLVAELRQRKAAMDSTAYERELEQLLVKLAETNQALRALEPKP
jgi:hypothetical protein